MRGQNSERNCQEFDIQHIMLFSMVAYLLFSRARFTFNQKDIEHAKMALSYAIIQIQEVIYRAMLQHQTIKKFDELQELEADLNQALNFITEIYSAISA